MYEEVEELLEKAKAEIDNEKFCKNECMNYLSTSDLFGDDYSCTEIEAMQKEFMDNMKEWLHENYPGTFVIYTDWCVHVAHKDLFPEKRFEKLIVN